jgi:hypothetical protein
MILFSPLPSPSFPPNPVFCTFIVLAASFRAMKALFNRFNRARAHSKGKVKDPTDSDSLSPPATSYQKEKLPQLPPLREWLPPLPPLEQPQRSIGTPSSITSHKHLPERSSRPLPPIEDSLVHFTSYDPISISDSKGPLSHVTEEDSVDTNVGTRTVSPRADQNSAGRNSRKTGNGSIATTDGSSDVPKKAAFLSPRSNSFGSQCRSSLTRRRVCLEHEYCCSFATFTSQSPPWL